MTDLTVNREEQGQGGAFLLTKEGRRVGELTFTRVGSGVVTLDHTQVADELKGQGAGRKLLDAAVAWARATNTKLAPVCPYAKAQFEKDASIGDVLNRAAS